MADNADSDRRYELAYDQAKRALDHQQAALRDLRSRAGNLISISAAVTSFAAGVGLIRTDPDKGAVFPGWAAFVLLALLVAIGVTALAVLWPREWRFTLNATGIIERYIESPTPLSYDKLQRELAIHLQANYVKNRRNIGRRATAYQVGIGLLVLEVIVLVLALRQGG
jgi:hypothetical protein